MDLLVGNENVQLDPIQKITVGQLVIKESIFSQGLMMNGSHEDLRCGPVQFNATVQVLRAVGYMSHTGQV